MKKKIWFRYLITALAVIASSFLQTYAIKVFVEPLLIVTLTVLVGLIVLAIVVPMFQMYSSIQQM